MLKSILILLIASNLAFSASVVPIKKGDIAQFSGALVTAEKLDQFRKTDELAKLRVKQIQNLRDLSIVKDQRIEFYQRQVTVTRRELFKSDSKRFMTNVGYFVLGTLLTGFAAKAAIQATR